MDEALFSAIHVSDFHFGADVTQINLKTVMNHRRVHGGFRGLLRALNGPHRQTVQDPDITRAAAKFILDNFEPRSLMLISGDVAATGTEGDLVAGVRFLQGAPSSRVPFLTDYGWPTIAGGSFDICLVPGNHDRYQTDWGYPGSRLFDRHFANHWDGSSAVRTTVVQTGDSPTKLAIVAADLCLPQGFRRDILNLQRYGHGFALDTTVDLMCQHTEDARRRYGDVGVCWLIHFPPSLNENDIDPDLSLIDGHRVEGAARRLGIELIIAGHIHRSEIFSRGRLQVACAGSATAALEVSGSYLHYLEIRVTSTGTAVLEDRLNFRWSRSMGGFQQCA